MDVSDLLAMIGERYGLLPVYALIISWAGFSASGVRQLLTSLAILAGIYVVMFRAFNLGAQLDVFGLGPRLGLSPDLANTILGAAFVFGLGFGAFGLKRLFVRKPREA